MNTVTLTGVKPTGQLHLGNLIGAIKPIAQLANDPQREVLVFVADLHALNAHPEPDDLRKHTRELVAAYMACGLDPRIHANTNIFRQSDVMAVPVLSTLLMNVCSKGELNRAHAYKAMVAANIETNRDPDHGVNMGLYTYPVLMASDILAFGAHEVPVGRDQVQHLEMAKDLGESFGRRYGDGVLTAPKALVKEDAAVIPGLDGRKMSKSYNNTIPLFASEQQTTKLVKSIKTDSQTPEASKDPEQCTLISLLRHVAPANVLDDMCARYRLGGIGYGEVKAVLAENINDYLRLCRREYQQIISDDTIVDQVLSQGKVVANTRANVTIEKVMQAIGVR